MGARWAEVYLGSMKLSVSSPCALSALLVLAALPGTDGPSDWPAWRGPGGTGVSSESGWSSKGADEPLWEASVGLGYSSPSIAQGRLYTRGFHEAQGVDVTVCLDVETGKEIWRHATPAKLWNNMHGGGTLTTPVVAGDTVYVLSRMGPVMALATKDGTPRWTRDLPADFGIELGPFGLSSSPLVLGSNVLVNVGKCLLLDKDSGETVWETKDYGVCYSTPAPFTWKDKPCLAVFNGSGLAILDAKSGKQLALHEWTSGYNVNAATPIVLEDLVFISTGYNQKGGALLQFTGDALEPVWESRKMNNNMNGCVLVDEHLYGFDDAVLRCLGLDGEERWAERGLGKGTVIAAAGRLIVLSEDGELLIAPASEDGFAPAYRTKVLAEGPCWTTPVLADGRIYVRNAQGRLVCRDHRATK